MHGSISVDAQLDTQGKVLREVSDSIDATDAAAAAAAEEKTTALIFKGFQFISLSFPWLSKIFLDSHRFKLDVIDFDMFSQILMYFH